MRVFFDYLALANLPAGVNGLEAQNALGLDRNQQGRLTEKLVVAGWLARISNDDSDNRSHFVRTSPLAVQQTLELESALTKTMRPVRAPKAATPSQGMRSLFDLDGSGSDD